MGTNLIGSDPNATTNVMSAVSYRGFGAVKTLNYGNGRRLALTYSDQRQYLKTMKVDRQNNTDTIINKQYTYYNDGRIQQIQDYVDSAWTTEYSYDAFNRLSWAQGGAYGATWKRVYDYDYWGNLKSLSNLGQGSYVGEVPNYTISYANNASGAPATNRMQSVAQNGQTITYGYDAAGNLTAEGSTTITWDAAGRQKSVSDGSGTHSYGDDGNGARVRQTAAGQSALYYVRSSLIGQVIGEVGATQGLSRMYVYAGGRLIAQRSYGQFYWQHKDHPGSGHKLTDTNGTVAWRGEYDPHGQMLLETGSLALNKKKYASA